MVYQDAKDTSSPKFMSSLCIVCSFFLGMLIPGFSGCLWERVIQKITFAWCFGILQRRWMPADPAPPHFCGLSSSHPHLVVKFSHSTGNRAYLYKQCWALNGSTESVQNPNSGPITLCLLNPDGADSTCEGAHLGFRRTAAVHC